MAAPNANNATNDPFQQLEQFVYKAVNPTPSPGFGTRLKALYAVEAYYVAVLLVFYLLYGISQRRQNIKPWLFRFVRKSEGRFIMQNVYVISTLPSIPAAALLCGLINNCQRTFLWHESQANAFYWRNLVWVLVWLHGWIAAYGMLQAVLITSTTGTYLWVPPLVNTLYVTGPIVIITAMLIPGILSARTWSKTMHLVNETLAMLKQGSAQFQATGTIDRQAFQQVSVNLNDVDKLLDTFQRQWLVMLVIWAVVSVFLNVISGSGFVLVVKLRRQLKYDQSIRTPGANLDTILSHHPSLSHAHTLDHNGGNGGAELNEKVESSGAKSAEGRRTSTVSDMFKRRGGRANAATVRNESSPHQVVSAGGGARDASVEAMRRLFRDVTVQSIGLLMITAIFVAATTLLAIKRRDAYNVWVFVELGLTMPIWAYSVGAAIVMTFIALNQAIWLWNTRPSQDCNVTTVFADPRHAMTSRSGRGGGGAGGGDGSGIDSRVQVTTFREIQIDDNAFPVAAPRHRRELVEGGYANDDRLLVKRASGDGSLSLSSATGKDSIESDLGPKYSPLLESTGAMPMPVPVPEVQQTQPRRQVQVRLPGERGRDRLYPTDEGKNPIAPFS